MGVRVTVRRTGDGLLIVHELPRPASADDDAPPLSLQLPPGEYLLEAEVPAICRARAPSPSAPTASRRRSRGTSCPTVPTAPSASRSSPPPAAVSSASARGTSPASNLPSAAPRARPSASCAACRSPAGSEGHDRTGMSFRPCLFQRARSSMSLRTTASP
jgi:hypothetical protein